MSRIILTGSQIVFWDREGRQREYVSDRLELKEMVRLRNDLSELISSTVDGLIAERETGRDR